MLCIFFSLILKPVSRDDWLLGWNTSVKILLPLPPPASLFNAILIFWILPLSHHSWLPIVLPTSPVATGRKWPVHSSAGRAANIISKNQGLKRSLVSSLNDYEKQLRHWSHQFKDRGMSTEATNTWVAFLCHSKSLVSKWKITNIKLNIDKSIFQLKN